MKAIQKIIFALSMAVVLTLCQVAFADDSDPTFIKDKQKLDTSTDDNFKEKLENYRSAEKTKEELMNSKLSDAKDIVDETQSWWEYAIDIVAYQDNIAEAAIKKGSSILEAEVLGAQAVAAMVQGKCTLAAGEDAAKIAKCREVSKSLEEYVQATKDWKDAKTGREDYEKMQSSAEDVFYALDCTKDASGNEKCERIYFTQECDEVTGKCTYIQKSGVAKGCTPLPIKLSETKTCLFCPLFKVVFDAANTMATNSYATLARPLAMVMLIGLAIYIAFKVMVLTSGFVKQDAPKFITETLTQVFKVLLAYILLYNANQIYIFAISPVLSAGLEFGTAIMGGEYSKYLKSCATGALGASSGLLSSGLYARLDCFIRAVQEEIAIPQSMGSSLMCIAIRRGGTVQNVIPDFSMLFVGLIIWVFAWLVMLAFGFYLIDATIRIGIVGALMPFLIATWPFKATAKYASTGWGMILNTFFVYVFMGIVIAVNVTLMFISIGGENGQTELYNLINGTRIQEIKDKLDLGFGEFLILIIGCLFGFKLTGQSASLAGSFAGGAGPDLAPSIGGLMASGATGVAKKTAGVAGGVGGWALEKSGVSGAVRNARDKVARGAANVVSGVFGGYSNSPKPKTMPSGTPTSGAPKTNTNQNQRNSNNQNTNSTPNENTNQNQNGNNGNSNQNTNQNQNGNNTNSNGNTNQNQNGNGDAYNANPRNASRVLNSENKANLDAYKNERNRNQKAWNDTVAFNKMYDDLKNQPVPKTGDATVDAKAEADKVAKLQHLQTQKNSGEQRIMESEKPIQEKATKAYVGIKKAEAMKQGKPFNEKETEKYANENFDAVAKELDGIIEQNEKR
ncbi:MAG: hypothetical protein ACK5N8_07065 [Alphaproteobacteria bacterium]